MPDYVRGQRYPMTAEEAHKVLRHAWPLVASAPDLSRGRMFVAAPASWTFWLLDGRQVTFDFQPGMGLTVAVGREPDPERPDPLTSGG